MIHNRRLALATAVALSACGTSKSDMSFSTSNPFATASPLLYQAPPFDRIRNEDYQPALEEGMRVQIADCLLYTSDAADE